MLKEDEEKLARDSTPLTIAQMQELMSRIEKLKRDERNTEKIKNNIDARLSGIRVPLLSPKDLE